MGFFDLFRQPDINQGVEEYRAVPQAILLDVRTPKSMGEGMFREAGTCRCSRLKKLQPLRRRKRHPCSSTASPGPEAARQ